MRLAKMTWKSTSCRRRLQPNSKVEAAKTSPSGCDWLELRDNEHCIWEEEESLECTFEHAVTGLHAESRGKGSKLAKRLTALVEKLACPGVLGIIASGNSVCSFHSDLS